MHDGYEVGYEADYGNMTGFLFFFFFWNGGFLLPLRGTEGLISNRLTLTDVFAPEIVKK